MNKCRNKANRVSFDFVLYLRKTGTLMKNVKCVCKHCGCAFFLPFFLNFSNEAIFAQSVLDK